MILALNAMQEICAQDSLSIKMNQIDEYREDLLSQKDNLLCVKFPLNMYDVDENSCYIDYEKPDTIYYYFQDSYLVFVEHRTDRWVGDCDTDDKRFLEYKRMFFMDGRLCLEEHYYSCYIEGWSRPKNGKEFIATFCDITEFRTYWDVTTDKVLAETSREVGPYILESKADSVLNATKWNYKSDLSRYKYDIGQDHYRVPFCSIIEENGFVFPDGVKMPYSE